MDKAKTRRRWPWVLGGIAAVVVLLAVVGSLALDGWLLGRVRQEADEYAAKLGRPIEIGGLSTRFLGGFGATVKDVKVGAAPGEELPLATIESVEVRAALWPLLRSRGDDVQVHAVEVRRPEVTVVRLPDGTTNLDHVMKRLDAMAAEEPAAESAEQDLSGVRLASFELRDGRIKLVDRSAGTAREVAINDLDVALKDLRAGAPLDVSLNAAVLAEKQNLKVSLTSTPLPKSLRPTPDKVAIKAEPIDLSPLAPFFPKDVGFLGGSLDADFTAQLGRAVPGGDGPTNVKGVLRAMGLKFRGAQGGKALDVVVDSDLSGDAVAGTLDLRKLEIALGPARISGRGKVMNLAGDRPSVEGFEIVGRNLDPAVLAEYYPPLDDMVGGRIEGPIGLVATASGSQDSPAIAFNLDFAQTNVRLPEQLTKAAGAPMRVSGTVRGAGKGAYAFDAAADLKGADLRPGEIINKGPGERFELEGRGTFSPGATARDPMRVKLSALAVRLLEDELSGTASAELTDATTTFDLAMKSARLDADRMLIPDDEEKKASGAPKETKDPDRFDGLRGTVALDVGSLKYEDVQMSNVVIRMKMVDDQITLEQLRAGAFGGTLKGDGTKVALGPEKWPFELKLAADGVDLGAALARKNPSKKALAGSFNGDIALKGAGTEFEEIAETLAGAIQGSLFNGSFLGADLVQAVSEPLAKALPFAARALKGEGLTRLGDELPFGVTIENGVAKLKKPITFTRPQAAITFDGGIQLDGELDLAGTVALTPQAVSSLTSGRAKLTEPLPIALNVTGPAWKPRVGGIDVKPAAAVIARHAAAGAAEKVIGDRFGEKGKAVSDAVKAGPEQLKREAEQKAAEERARAEARAREEAERARKRAEEEAKKRLRGVLGGPK